MEQSELKDAVLAARVAAPAPTVVVPEAQTQANLNERVVQIKAAGGIRNLRTALAMVRAGASRLGASAGVQIVQEAVA